MTRIVTAFFISTDSPALGTIRSVSLLRNPYPPEARPFVRQIPDPAMLRNTLCVGLLALSLVGTADAVRSVSTHLAMFLAASAADAATAPRLREASRVACEPGRPLSAGCQQRWQVASRS